MSIYAQMQEVLQGLAGGRVFSLVADQGAETPYVVIQRVGGPPINFLTGEAPAKSFHRVQVTAWGATALEVEAIGAELEAAIRAADHLQPEVLATAVDTYDETTTYRGSRLEFRLFC